MLFPALTLSLTLGIPTLLAATAPLVQDEDHIDTDWFNQTNIISLLVDAVPKSFIEALPDGTLVPVLFPPNMAPTPSSPSPTFGSLDIPLTSIIDLTPILWPTQTPAPTNSFPPPKAAWSAPSMFTNLDTFQVQKFASGKTNLQLVNGIPASASNPIPQLIPTVVPFAPPLFGPSSPTWDNTSTVMQLLYPATSSNPAGNPVGGAEIYFSPLDLSNAQNVTLEYSVFFPFNFDWVLAGKLPGLYGGHEGCSGGNDALDCFSTRMMWRQMGAGELYLVCISVFDDSVCLKRFSVCAEG